MNTTTDSSYEPTYKGLKLLVLLEDTGNGVSYEPTYKGLKPILHLHLAEFPKKLRAYL